MSSKKSYIGVRFGKLELVAKSDTPDKWGRMSNYIAECECGNRIEINLQRLRQSQKYRDCGCGAYTPESREDTDFAALKQMLNGEVLVVEPKTLVIVDLDNSAAVITAVDGNRHVSITIAKSTIDRALERFTANDKLTTYTIDSDTWATHKPKPSANSLFTLVRTLIVIKRDTKIVRANVN